MNLCLASLISKDSYLNTFEGKKIFQEMLVIFEENRQPCKFTSLVPSCRHALQTASFLLPAVHPVEMASAFLFLCYCSSAAAVVCLVAPIFFEEQSLVVVCVRLFCLLSLLISGLC